MTLGRVIELGPNIREEMSTLLQNHGICALPCPLPPSRLPRCNPKNDETLAMIKAKTDSWWYSSTWTMRWRHVVFRGWDRCRGQNMTDVSRGVGTHDTHRRTEYHQKWHDGDETQNLWQNQVAGWVHAHDIKGVDLLCHPSSCPVPKQCSSPPSQKVSDTWWTMKTQHDFTCGVTSNPARHPRTLMLIFIWMQITAPMKNEMSSTIPDGVYTQLRHLLWCISFMNMCIRSGRAKRATHQYPSNARML